MLKQKALKKDGSRNQVTATEHEPAVNGREKMVGCDVRHTDMQGKIQGALEHLQEGTRESRPKMGTGHQQQHWNLWMVWCACFTMQTGLWALKSGWERQATPNPRGYLVE